MLSVRATALLNAFVCAAAAPLSLSWSWLGPFPIGKSEFDADSAFPLLAAPFSPRPTLLSELVPGGAVKGWLRLFPDAEGGINR